MNLEAGAEGEDELEVLRVRLLKGGGVVVEDPLFLDRVPRVEIAVEEAIDVQPGEDERPVVFDACLSIAERAGQELAGGLRDDLNLARTQLCRRRSGGARR